MLLRGSLGPPYADKRFFLFTFGILLLAACHCSGTRQKNGDQGNQSLEKWSAVRVEETDESEIGNKRKPESASRHAVKRNHVVGQQQTARLAPIGEAIKRRIPRKLANSPPHQSDNDLHFAEYQGAFGRPGVDFPALSAVPLTKFSCKQVKHSESGYYADLETNCQVFHICDKGRKTSFLCPNGTIFRQSHLICDWWFRVDCERSPELYEQSAEHLVADQNISKERAEAMAKAMVNALRNGSATPEQTSVKYSRPSSSSFLYNNNFNSESELPNRSLFASEVNNGLVANSQASTTAAPLSYDGDNYQHHEHQVLAETASFTGNNKYPHMDNQYLYNYLPTSNTAEEKPKYVENQVPRKQDSQEGRTAEIADGTYNDGSSNSGHLDSTSGNKGIAHTSFTPHTDTLNSHYVDNGKEDYINQNRYVHSKPPNHPTQYVTTANPSSAGFTQTEAGDSYQPPQSPLTSQNSFQSQQNPNRPNSFQSQQFPVIATANPSTDITYQTGPRDNYQPSQSPNPPQDSFHSQRLPSRPTSQNGFHAQQFPTTLQDSFQPQQFPTITTASPSSASSLQTNFGDQPQQAPNAQQDSFQSQRLPDAPTFQTGFQLQQFPTTLKDSSLSQQFPTTLQDSFQSQRFPTTVQDSFQSQRFPTTLQDNVQSQQFPTTAQDSIQSQQFPTTLLDNVQLQHISSTSPPDPSSQKKSEESSSKVTISEVVLTAKPNEAEEASTDRTISDLLTKMTKNGYDHLFSSAGEQSLENGTVFASEQNTVLPGRVENNDLETDYSLGIVQSGSNGNQKEALNVTLKNSADLRELAQIFSRALSAYLEDPEKFRKVLSEVRPTEPPVTQNSINSESEDELLSFEEDQKFKSYPQSQYLLTTAAAPSPTTTGGSFDISNPSVFANEVNSFMSNVNLAAHFSVDSGEVFNGNSDSYSLTTLKTESRPNRLQYSSHTPTSSTDGILDIASTTPSLDGSEKNILAVNSLATDQQTFVDNKFVDSYIPPTSRNVPYNTGGQQLASNNGNFASSIDSLYLTTTERYLERSKENSEGLSRQHEQFDGSITYRSNSEDLYHPTTPFPETGLNGNQKGDFFNTIPAESVTQNYGSQRSNNEGKYFNENEQRYSTFYPETSQFKKSGGETDRFAENYETPFATESPGQNEISKVYEFNANTLNRSFTDSGQLVTESPLPTTDYRPDGSSESYFDGEQLLQGADTQSFFSRDNLVRSKGTSETWKDLRLQDKTQYGAKSTPRQVTTESHFNDYESNSRTDPDQHPYSGMEFQYNEYTTLKPKHYKESLYSSKNNAEGKRSQVPLSANTFDNGRSPTLNPEIESQARVSNNFPTTATEAFRTTFTDFTSQRSRGNVDHKSFSVGSVRDIPTQQNIIAETSSTFYDFSSLPESKYGEKVGNAESRGAMNDLMDVMNQAKTNNTLKQQLVFLLVSDRNGSQNKTVEELKQQILKVLLQSESPESEGGVNQETTERPYQYDKNNELGEELKTTDQMHLISRVEDTPTSPPHSIVEGSGNSRFIVENSGSPSSTERAERHEDYKKPINAGFGARTRKKIRVVHRNKLDTKHNFINNEEDSKVPSRYVVRRAKQEKREPATPSRLVSGTESALVDTDNRAINLLRSLFSLVAN